MISGNVSLYNETLGQAIYPTPTIAVVGLIEPWQRHAVSGFRGAGREIVLLGETREELGGSEWLALRRGLERGEPPTVDLEHELRLHRLLREGVAAGEVESAHDVADGGLAVALTECCFGAVSGAGRPVSVGAEVEIEASLRPDALLFGESTGRVVVGTQAADALLRRAEAIGVPARRMGRTGGERLVIRPAGAGAAGAESSGAWIDASVEALREVWEAAIPRRMEGDE